MPKQKPRATKDTAKPVEDITGVMEELRALQKEISDMKATIKKQPAPVSRAADSTPTSSHSTAQLQPYIANGAAMTTPSEAIFSPQPSTSTSDYSLLGPTKNPTMDLPATPSSQLPDIDIVPNNVKSEIIKGKDVNLALLLLPIKDRKYVAIDRDVQIRDNIFTLSSKRDHRLSRDLTIMEFITAFNIYKCVLYKEYPNFLFRRWFGFRFTTFLWFRRNIGGCSSFPTLLPLHFLIIFFLHLLVITRCVSKVDAFMCCWSCGRVLLFIALVVYWLISCVLGLTCVIKSRRKKYANLPDENAFMVRTERFLPLNFSTLTDTS